MPLVNTNKKCSILYFKYVLFCTLKIQIYPKSASDVFHFQPRRLVFVQAYTYFAKMFKTLSSVNVDICFLVYKISTKKAENIT